MLRLATTPPATGSNSRASHSGHRPSPARLLPPSSTSLSIPRHTNRAGHPLLSASPDIVDKSGIRPRSRDRTPAHEHRSGPTSQQPPPETVSSRSERPSLAPSPLVPGANRHKSQTTPRELATNVREGSRPSPPFEARKPETASPARAVLPTRSNSAPTPRGWQIDTVPRQAPVTSTKPECLDWRT